MFCSIWAVSWPWLVTEARQEKAATIVAETFPSYAERFFAGAPDPHTVEGITARAREIMQRISRFEENPAVGQKMAAYPTDEQMQELYEAHKAGKPGAIAGNLENAQGGGCRGPSKTLGDITAVRNP